MRQTVTFKSHDDAIIGHFYLPDDADLSNQYPAIVVGGPGGTVKEQASAVFAEALAVEGFVTLSFDYRRFGESEGRPRQYEDPASNGTAAVFP